MTVKVNIIKDEKFTRGRREWIGTRRAVITEGLCMRQCVQLTRGRYLQMTKTTAHSCTLCAMCCRYIVADDWQLRAQPVNPFITSSALALHCCKAHAKINRKIENSTPCKIVTHEDFNLKLGTRDYVADTTHHATLGSNRPSGGFSPNTGNITPV